MDWATTCYAPFRPIVLHRAQLAKAGHHGVEPAGVGPDGRSWMRRAVTMRGDGRSMDDRVV